MKEIFNHIVNTLSELRDNLTQERDGYSHYFDYDLIVAGIGIMLLVFGLVGHIVGMIVAGAIFLAAPITVPLCFFLAITIGYFVGTVVMLPVFLMVELLKFIVSKIGGKQK